MLGESLVLPPPKKKRPFLRAGFLGFLLGAAVALVPEFLPRWMWHSGLGLADLESNLNHLELEYPLASSRKPYLVLDLIASRLEFRIRGVILKTIPFYLDSVVTEEGTEPLSSERLSLYSLRDRGAPIEVIQPPDPDRPLDPLEDPSILPPDPPSTYTLSFDQPLRVRIKGVEKEDLVPAIREAARTVQGWLSTGAGESEPGGTTVEIRMASNRSQEIYRALFMGEKFLVFGIGEAEK